MNTRAKLQFTTATILGATTTVAVVLVVLPFACQVNVELVALSVLFLCLLVSITDQLSQSSISYFRSLLSILLAIAAIALVVNVARGKVSFFPTFPIVLATFTAILRPSMVKIGKYPIARSSLGCVLLSVIVCLQFYRTSSQRYFVNRYLTSWYASDNVERDGGVTYRLRSHLGDLRAPSEIETLWAALDVESQYRPITKCRLLCGSDKIDSLSFAFAASPSDWMKLRSLRQLDFLDFNSLQISDEEVKSLSTLTELEQLAFFQCDLPTNFLGSCRNSKSLRVLQIANCNIHDLVGLSALQELRKLNLHETKLTQAELNEVAKLNFLMDLDLRGTRLSDEDFAYFAKLLKANASLRRGRFRCVVSYDPSCTQGLPSLIDSGAISELVIAGFAPTEELNLLK